MKKDFLPILLGCDECAYGLTRMIYEEYKIKPLVLCSYELTHVMYSKLINLEIIEDFSNPEVFTDALLKVLHREKDNYEKLLVIPTIDYYTELVVNNYDRFEGLIANKFVSRELFERSNTKDKFAELCKEYNVPHPRTMTITCEERLAAADKIPFDFPIVLKPDNSNAAEYFKSKFDKKKKVYYVFSKEEYLEIMRSMNTSTFKGNMVAQEYIPGGDDAMCEVCTYSDADGKLRAISLAQTVLEEYRPDRIGNSAAVITRYDEELYDLVKDFLEGIGYVGFTNIDMKRDPRDGRTVLFEINPRMSRMGFYVRAAGYNIMKTFIDDVVYDHREPCVYVKEKALWRNVPISVLKKYIRKEPIRSEVLDLINKNKCEYVLECKDDLSLKRRILLFRIKRNWIKEFKKYFYERS